MTKKAYSKLHKNQSSLIGIGRGEVKDDLKHIKDQLRLSDEELTKGNIYLRVKKIEISGEKPNVAQEITNCIRLTYETVNSNTKQVEEVIGWQFGQFDPSGQQSQLRTINLSDNEYIKNIHVKAGAGRNIRNKQAILTITRGFLGENKPDIVETFGSFDLKRATESDLPNVNLLFGQSSQLYLESLGAYSSSYEVVDPLATQQAKPEESKPNVQPSGDHDKDCQKAKEDLAKWNNEFVGLTPEQLRDKLNKAEDNVKPTDLPDDWRLSLARLPIIIAEKNLAREATEKARRETAEAQTNLAREQAKNMRLEDEKTDLSKEVLELRDRPAITKQEYQKLLANQEKHKPTDLKPTDLPTNWKEQLEELNNWQTQFPNKKPAEVNNQLGDNTKLTEEINKLNKDKDQLIKDKKDLQANKDKAENSLKEWTSTFPNNTPAKVKEEWDFSKDEVNVLEDETKELNGRLKEENNKLNLANDKLEKAEKELAQLKKAEEELGKWTSAFPGKTPEQVKGGMKQELTAEQQEAIAKYPQTKTDLTQAQADYLKVQKAWIIRVVDNLNDRLGNAGLKDADIDGIYKQSYQELITKSLTWNNRDDASLYADSIKTVVIKKVEDNMKVKHASYKDDIDKMKENEKLQMAVSFKKLAEEAKSLNVITNKKNPLFIQGSELTDGVRNNLDQFAIFWRNKLQTQENADTRSMALEARIEVPSQK